MNSQEMDRLRDERRSLQQEVREQRNFLDNLGKERLDLESEVRKLRNVKDVNQKKIR